MGPYKKVCEYCKKEFTSRNITQRFCCSECRELYHKKEKKEYKKVCEYCGKEFITCEKTQRFCCDKCRQSFHKNNIKELTNICKCKYEKGG